MNAKELLDELNELDEHSRIEAKRASELGSSVLETICAFSNEPGLGGGWILLGVTPEEGTFWPQYKAVGVDSLDKLTADLASKCASEFNQVIRVQITPETLQEKKVLVIFVPELPPGQKPLYFTKRGLPNGAFRRIGSTDQRCNDDDLLVFYQGRGGETYDSTVVPSATLDHLDPEAISTYREMRSESNPDAEELQWNNDDLLEAFGCAVRVNGELKPTASGILLFGTSQALRRFFPMTRIDYIRVPGREWIRDPDRRFETVEIRAPLIPAIRRARNTIIDDLPKAFSLPPGKMRRKDIPLVPDRVVREAIVNAVMHRSYRSNSPIQIIRYSNRLEIRNPGYSLKSEDRLGDPGSENRNPHIAAVLHETNLAETKGSGIRVMRKLMQEAALTPPTFESDRSGNQFVVTMLFHHFLSPSDLEWLKRFADSKLTDEEARAVIFVREVGAINNRAYREINEADTLNASQHLRRLCRHDILKMKGKGTAAYYVLADGHVKRKGDHKSDRLDSKSGRLEAKSDRLEAESGRLEGESDRLETHRDELIRELNLSLQARLGQLQRRTPKEVLRRLIRDICDERPMMISELAILADRGRSYLMEEYVTPMVREGLLEMTFPETPSHPVQRYRAIKSK